MNQVEYNLRYGRYAAEQKAIARKYSALRNQVEPGSPKEDALEAQEEAEIDAVRSAFHADTANFGSK